jgi:hypothetical protein
VNQAPELFVGKGPGPFWKAPRQLKCKRYKTKDGTYKIRENRGKIKRTNMPRDVQPWFPDVIGEICDYSADAVPNYPSREWWYTMSGRYRTVFVTADNVGDILIHIAEPNSTLYNALFVIYAFDGAVVALLPVLLRYIRKLKINFRLKIGQLEREYRLSVTYMCAGLPEDDRRDNELRAPITSARIHQFTDVVVQCLDILKASPALHYLKLDFITDEYTRAAGVCEIPINRRISTALSSLKDLPGYQLSNLVVDVSI